MSKILIVDDEPSIRLVLSAHIRKLGHSVQSAENGRVAIDKINKIVFVSIIVYSY